MMLTMYLVLTKDHAMVNQLKTDMIPIKYQINKAQQDTQVIGKEVLPRGYKVWCACRGNYETYLGNAPWNHFLYHPSWWNGLNSTSWPLGMGWTRQFGGTHPLNLVSVFCNAVLHTSHPQDPDWNSGTGGNQLIQIQSSNRNHLPSNCLLSSDLRAGLLNFKQDLSLFLSNTDSSVQMNTLQ